MKSEKEFPEKDTGGKSRSGKRAARSGETADGGLMSIRFSISAKLVTIITVIVLISLGSIIALVSWLVRQDLRIVAEENNFNTNHSAALEAEAAFVNVRSNSRILMRTIAALGTGSALARESEEFFFEENPTVGAIFFTTGADTGEFLFNKRFFDSREIDISLLESYRDAHVETLMRAAAGETVLLNSAPHFAAPLLALFFPWQNGVGGGVLFSSEALNESFGSGINLSYLINDSGDILVSPDFEMVRTGVNTADSKFTRFIWDSPARNVQTLFTDDDSSRYFSAFTKLNIAGAVVVTNAEYGRVFEGIAATTRRNIYLAIVVLSFSIILIWFFSKTISVPLRELAAAANVIEGGTFNVELRPRGHDEIGVLTASFRRMCAALGVFGRFTNRYVALGAMRGEIKPGGLPKRATIFFSDIRGFTEKSENFTKAFGDEASDRIVNWLNDYFTRMVGCVEKTGGIVDKFIGDAMMAHWGTAHTTGSARKDACNCVAAALMMRAELYRMNKTRRPGDPENPPIRIGCGINTGIVTAGQIGSVSRMEYTVTGPPVNLASRIEAMNKYLCTDILITEHTWRLVRKRFITEEMPAVMVRGKEESVRLFAVVNFTKTQKGPKSLTKVRKILGFKAAELRRIGINPGG